VFSLRPPLLPSEPLLLLLLLLLVDLQMEVLDGRERRGCADEMVQAQAAAGGRGCAVLLADE